MGRPRENKVDAVKLLEMRADGVTGREAAAAFGVSQITISRTIAELEKNKKGFTKYRALQNIQLTAIQYRVLSELEIRDPSEIPTPHLVLIALALERIQRIFRANVKISEVDND